MDKEVEIKEKKASLAKQYIKHEIRFPKSRVGDMNHGPR